MPTALIAHPSADVYGSDRQLLEAIAAFNRADIPVAGGDQPGRGRARDVRHRRRSPDVPFHRGAPCRARRPHRSLPGLPISFRGSRGGLRPHERGPQADAQYGEGGGAGRARSRPERIVNPTLAKPATARATRRSAADRSGRGWRSRELIIGLGEPGVEGRLHNPGVSTWCCAVRSVGGSGSLVLHCSARGCWPGCPSGAAHGHAPALGALASGSAPAAPTPRAASAPGSVHRTVRSVAVTVKPPVSLRAVADFGAGVAARIMSVKAIEYHAVAPGQVSGPGLRLVIQVSNGTGKSIGLDNAVVTIADARGTPGLRCTHHPGGERRRGGHPVPGNFSYPLRGSSPRVTRRAVRTSSRSLPVTVIRSLSTSAMPGGPSCYSRETPHEQAGRGRSA